MNLIDRDALNFGRCRGEMIKKPEMEHARLYADMEDIANAIKEAPTIDAVPVVRCKDCKSYCPNMVKLADAETPEQVEAWSCFDGFCSRYLKRFDPNDFCSYGEAKTEGE